MNTLRVFISHSSNDAETANKICDFLENNGIQCWIAPRDIPYGSAYGESIDYAFRECTDALFLLSSASLKSKKVENELYLANLEQKSGMRIFPVYLEPVELTGSFRYFLSSSHSCQGIDSLSLKKLLKNLERTPAPLDLYTAVNSDETIRTLIRNCIKRYFYIYGSKNYEENINNRNKPVISTEASQLSNDIHTILFLSYIEPLWHENNKNLLYIGKNCFGKKTNLFMFFRKMMEKEEALVIFYVPLSSCFTYTGQDRIILYIYRNYIERFNASLSFYELHNYIYNDKIQAEIPRVIILIDGLDDCTAEYYDDIQFELDGLITNTNIQLLLTSNTTKHMFYLGNIPVKSFNEACLKKMSFNTYWGTSIGKSDEKSTPLKQMIEKKKSIEEKIQKNTDMLEKVQKRERLRESRSKFCKLHEKTKTFKGGEGERLNKNVEAAITNLDGQISKLVNTTTINDRELQIKELETENTKLIEVKEVLEGMANFLEKFICRLTL